LFVFDFRKALGEDSQQPRLIKTFPQTGYRFIGEIETYNALAITAVTSVEIEKTMQIELESEAEVRYRSLYHTGCLTMG
jgi:DNA-binding winged helix-turn-helix (wHTH) protein